MRLRSSVGTVLTALLVITVIVMLVGQQLGQPILFGFVLTGSMSPTLEPGDGFVALPPSATGDIEEGDVVTFNARELQGGGLTTHRVVGETDEGYITRGDNNLVTDQDGPEPPVQDSQIVAVAWQVDDEVVVIPHLGTVAMGLQSAVAAISGFLAAVPGLGALDDGGLGSAMMGAGVLLLAYSFLTDILSSGRGRSREDRSRSRSGMIRASVVLVVILLLILAPATASMVVPSGINDLTIVSSQSPSGNPTVIERGGNQTVEYNVTNNGYLPLVAIIEPASTGVEVDETTHLVYRGESADTTATIYAPDETGVYYRAVSERQYIGVLPVPIIVALHNVHPVFAIAAVNGVLAGVVILLFAIAVGFRPFRFRDSSRDTSIADTIERKVRKWL